MLLPPVSTPPARIRTALPPTAFSSASVAVLGAVVLGVLKGAHEQGSVKLAVGAGVGAIVSSWGVVHTVFTLRYAALYYRGPDGSVKFNEDDKSTYVDFAYLAFTIGMTYQVSDTNLTTKAMRHTALRHALISYVLGTVIIAATINLAAGPVKWGPLLKRQFGDGRDVRRGRTIEGPSARDEYLGPKPPDLGRQL